MSTSHQQRRTVVAQTSLTIRHAREYGAFMALARHERPRAGHLRWRELALHWLCEAYPNEYDTLINAAGGRH